MYKIVMLQAFFAAELLPAGIDNLITWYKHIPADYITEYTVFECSDERAAWYKLESDYNVNDIDLNAYDFSDGTDCIAIEAYELRECAPGEKEKLITRPFYTRVHDGGDVIRYTDGPRCGFWKFSENEKVLAFISTLGGIKTGIPYRYNNRKDTWENCAGRYGLQYFVRLEMKNLIRYEY